MSVEPSPPRPEIEALPLLAEGRVFPPSPEFAAQANAKADLYEEAERDFEGFWARIARDRVELVEAVRHDARVGPAVRQVVRRRRAQHRLQLRRPARRAGPRPQGRLSLDRRAGRHPHADLRRPPSGGPEGRQRAQGARRQKGDVVAIYMPMIPELPIAMLACARLGAAHTVVFGGFSAEALAGRINDAKAKVLITADGGWRRGKPVPLKGTADDAIGAGAHDRACHRRTPGRRSRSTMARGPRHLVARHRGAPGR